MDNDVLKILKLIEAEEDIEDSYKYRKDNKIFGPKGIDWFKYFNGVPPEDDLNDYLWTGNYWVVDNYEDENE